MPRPKGPCCPYCKSFRVFKLQSPNLRTVYPGNYVRNISEKLCTISAFKSIHLTSTALLLLHDNLILRGKFGCMGSFYFYLFIFNHIEARELNPLKGVKKKTKTSVKRR